jgi:hypothetical protein
VIDIKQTFETEIIHGSGLTFKSLTIPKRSFSNKGLLENPKEIAKQLEFQIVDSVELGWLQHALVKFFAAEYIQDMSDWLYSFSKCIINKPEYFEFAAYLAMTPVVPFENSPLSAESLGNLLTKAGGYGVGAYIGFITGGTTPLLFITVPAGMVICGAAAGIGRGLEEGLRSRVRTLISGE